MDMERKDVYSLKSAFFIAAVYFLFGTLWIYFSDNAVEIISATGHEAHLLQTYKGIFYVFFTSVFLFYLSLRFLRAQSAAHATHLQTLEEQAQLEQSLQISYKMYYALFDNMLDSVAHCRMIYENGIPIDYEYINVNKIFESMTGLHNAIGRRISELIPHYAQENPDSLALFGDVALSGNPRKWEHHLKALDQWYSFSVYSPAKGEFIAIAADISKQKTAQYELKKHSALLDALINSSPDAIVIKDLEGHYVTFNEGAAKMVNIPSGRVIGKTAADLFPSETAYAIMTIDKHLIEEKTMPDHEEIILMPDREYKTFWVTKGTLSTDSKELFGTFGIYRDITEQKKGEMLLIEAKEHFDALAHHDPLTKLPNRLSLSEALEQKTASSAQQPFALCLLDLDRFKEINDAFSHRIGDLLLIEISRLLHDVFPANSFITRTGGDEFAIIMDNFHTPSPLIPILNTLQRILDNPFFIEMSDIYTTTSIGICFYPHDGTTQETLLQNADTALYDAKKHGGNTFSFYTEQMTTSVFEKTVIAGKLKKAIAQNEFLLFFQPQINPFNGSIKGMEALIRWKSPDGFIQPSTFIPICEETGLILEVGEFVLREGFTMAAKWANEGILHGLVAINVSARQLIHPNFLATLERILHQTQCSPAWIELEITESSILENPEKIIALLALIKAKGFHISIDDFGTGYSSLSYLKNLPIDKLKIDISFVRNVTDEPKNQTIVKTIIALAQGLGMQSLAEGVETDKELAFLRDNGIDSIQGFYYHKPIAQEAMELLLQSQSTTSL